MLESAAVAAGRRGKSPAPLPTRSKPRRKAAQHHVLVVDDDVEAMETLAELLEERGFRVERALDAVDAFALARQRMPDAVVTDLAMPGLSGFELARLLKSDPVTRAIPLIAVTGLFHSAEQATARAAGRFVQVLLKPVNGKELVSSLQAVLPDL